jgi:hypothetical protein
MPSLNVHAPPGVIGRGKDGKDMKPKPDALRRATAKAAATVLIAAGAVAAAHHYGQRAAAAAQDECRTVSDAVMAFIKTRSVMPADGELHVAIWRHRRGSRIVLLINPSDATGEILHVLDDDAGVGIEHLITCFSVPVYDAGVAGKSPPAARNLVPRDGKRSTR